MSGSHSTHAGSFRQLKIFLSHAPASSCRTSNQMLRILICDWKSEIRFFLGAADFTYSQYSLCSRFATSLRKFIIPGNRSMLMTALRCSRRVLISAYVKPIRRRKGFLPLLESFRTSSKFRWFVNCTFRKHTRSSLLYMSLAVASYKIYCIVISAVTTVANVRKSETNCQIDVTQSGFKALISP